MNTESIPYELKLDVLIKLKDLRDLKNMCNSSKSYAQVCKNERDYIVLNVFYNQYGKDMLSKGNVRKYIKKYYKFELFKTMKKLGVKWKDWVFIYAAKVGDLEIFKYLYENGANTLIKKYDWSEPVDWLVLFKTAIKFNRLNIIEYIYEKDPLILKESLTYRSIGDKMNIETLKWIVSKLEENNLDISILNDVLESNIFYGKLDIVKYLVENGSDVNSIEIHTNDLKVVDYLIDNGVDIESLLESNDLIDIYLFKYIFEQLYKITDEFVSRLLINYAYSQDELIVIYLVERYPKIAGKVLISRLNRSSRRSLARHQLGNTDSSSENGSESSENGSESSENGSDSDSDSSENESENNTSRNTQTWTAGDDSDSSD